MMKKGGSNIGKRITNDIREEHLFSEYQPLINSANDLIFAYEALMRSTTRDSPLKIIQDARNSGSLFELDAVCISNAIRGYPHTYLKKYFLFINVFPSTIVHDHFEKFIQDLLILYPWITRRVVLEINETELEQYIWGQVIFLKRLSFLKSLGFEIAFDDLSITRTSFKKMELLAPNFVKLDHTKSKNLADSEINQQLISLFLEFTNDKMRLVLEGIEAKEDLIVAKQLGVPLLQGYYISRPKRL